MVKRTGFGHRILPGDDYVSSAELPYGEIEGYGFVYVVGRDAMGPVKIGITVNARKRIYHLESMGGSKFPMIWLSPRCSNYAAIEKALHEKLHLRRGIGEWFNLPHGYTADKAARMPYHLYPGPDWKALAKAAERVKPISGPVFRET